MPNSKNGQLSEEELREFRKDLVGTDKSFFIEYIYENSFPHIHLYYVYNFPELLNPESYRSKSEKDLAEKVSQVVKKGRFNIEKYQDGNGHDLKRKDHKKIFVIYQRVHKEYGVPYHELLGCSIKK